MTTFASLFGGFGGADLGAQAAGLELAWSLELDPNIAAVADANLPHRVYVRDILDCDPCDFDAVDVLHASPPCPNFSVAKAGAVETELDIRLACKVVAFVTALKPRVFTLENVWAYRGSTSWRIIQDALFRQGYWVHVEHCNAADFGVPQTRKRMIARAVLGGFVPYLPAPAPWVGWYAAIEDLLPTLPESAFAPWQLARLPELLQTTLVGQGGYEGKIVTMPIDEPSPTVTANHNQIGVRAFLMPGSGNTNFAEAHPGKGCRYAEQPSHTIPAISSEGGQMPKAFLLPGQDFTQSRMAHKLSYTISASEPKHVGRTWLVNESSTMEVCAADGSSAAQVASHRNTAQRALLESGRVVSMTSRALARFQSFPDSYELPDNARLAAKGIGNAVPPLMMQRIYEQLMEEL